MITRPPRKKTPADGVNNVAVDLETPEASKSPAMPHERDESTGMTGGATSERMAQGHDDVERGVKDTSRGTEADETYRKLKKK